METKNKASLTRTTQETKNKVIELYQKGFSQNYMEKTLSMTRRTIRTILESEGIKRSKWEQEVVHCHVGTTLREDAFDLVSDDMAYWLGFLYADGYITNPAKTNSVGLLLKESDIGHIEKLKEFLKAPQNIWHDETHKSVKIQIGSYKLHQALQRWGFTTNKSYDAVPPTVMLYNRHFWRGMIDGDGYLGIINNIPRLHLCGTEDIVQGFRNFLILCGINTQSKVIKHPTKCLYNFHVSADMAVKSSKILYDSANVCLDRKFELYKSWLKTKYNDRIK